eukprot:350048-Chlamydomonas_euryale.AAC.6
MHESSKLAAVAPNSGTSTPPHAWRVKYARERAGALSAQRTVHIPSSTACSLERGTVAGVGPQTMQLHR